jgi:methionyl-tRNA formyltransferase
MRIVFAGTPAFAAAALQALIDARFDIALVLTQPDRAAGRGLHLSTGAVKQLATRHALQIAQPPSLRSEGIVASLRASDAHAMVVAAYGLILPPGVLEVFPGGCINIHASLLPRWRGAAPIQRALLAGDRDTGISIMRMEQGLDTGPVYLSRALPILPDDSAGSLEDRLAALGAQCIVETLLPITDGALAALPQPNEGITYAHKISKQEAVIDWTSDALAIERQVRAFNPSPGASSVLGNDLIKIWHARASDQGAGAAGEVLHFAPDGIDVACGIGTLKITELQKAGARRMSAADFLRGFTRVPGARFVS